MSLCALTLKFTTDPVVIITCFTERIKENCKHLDRANGSLNWPGGFSNLKAEFDMNVPTQQSARQQALDTLINHPAQ